MTFLTAIYMNGVIKLIRAFCCFWGCSFPISITFLCIQDEFISLCPRRTISRNQKIAKLLSTWHLNPCFYLNLWYNTPRFFIWLSVVIFYKKLSQWKFVLVHFHILWISSLPLTRWSSLNLSRHSYFLYSSLM